MAINFETTYKKEIFNQFYVSFVNKFTRLYKQDLTIIHINISSINMRTILCFFLFLIVIFSIQVQIKQIDLQKNIPAYIGIGYHVLIGNPFSSKMDEGFKAPIFSLTYEKGETTQDGMYRIPDFTHSSQSTSCSVEAKTTQYTGTKNYQKQLTKVVTIDTRLSYAFITAAFTFSKSFQDFVNSTQIYNQTSEQSIAECTLYTLQMPIFSNQIPLSLDFTEGVRRAFQQDDWNLFIQHFGTHFISSVTYGGRYLLQHTYSQQSLSLFKSLKIDTTFTAKIMFFQKLGINITKEMKNYMNQTMVVDSKVEVTREYKLGGTPPESGSWTQWAKTVQQNLAPVSYKTVTLSVLFNFINNLDANAAIKSYENYLNTYCLRNTCTPLTPDKPDPKPLVVSFLKSKQLSGPSKNQKTYDTNDGSIKVAMRVNKILIGRQSNIESIQFFLTDGITELALPAVGNKIFNSTYEVPKGDEIKCIRFGITYSGSYWKFTSMQFVTKKGSQSEVFSGSSKVNQYRILCVQNDEQHFVGFYGHYGSTFDSIGINILKQTMQK